MQVELFYIAHADPCGRNIEKNAWSNNKDGTGTLRYSTVLESRRVLLLSSNPEFYLSVLDYKLF